MSDHTELLVKIRKQFVAWAAIRGGNGVYQELIDDIDAALSSAGGKEVDPKRWREEIGNIDGMINSHPTSADKLEVVAIAWNYMGRPCVDTKFVPDKHAVEAGHITDIEPLVRLSGATRIITEQAERIEEMERNYALSLDRRRQLQGRISRLQRLAEAAEADRDRMKEALAGVLDEYDRNTCIHESTHRGGSIWTICDTCGAKWADDKGGFAPYSDPEPVSRARAALNGGAEK